MFCRLLFIKVIEMRQKMYLAIGMAVFLGGMTAYAGTTEVSSQDFGRLISIDDAISRTVNSHARVKEAMARLEKEKSLYRESRAEFFPKLGTEIFAAGATGQKSTVSYFQTTLEQPLFQGGKLFYGKKKQKVRVEAEEIRLQQGKQDLAFEIRLIYARALNEKEMLRFSQNEVREISRSRACVNALYENMLVSAGEVNRMNSMFASAKEKTVKHKENYDYLMSVLKQVMDINDSETIQLQTVSELPAIEDSVTEYLDAYRKTNAVYKLTELAMKEKEFEKKIIQADRYPQISLAVKWDVYNDTFVDNNRAMAGIIGKWDIWDFGRTGSKISAKTHEIEEVKWASRAKILEGEQEIYRLFHEARAIKEKIQMFDVQIVELQEYYKNEKVRLIAGQKADAEILESFLSLENMRISQIEAITDYRAILYKLQSSLQSSGGKDA